MKIITYNILDGFENAETRKINCANWLQSQSPDIVFLNELNGFTDRSLNEFAKSWNHSFAVLLNGRSDYKIGITSNQSLSNVEFYFKDLFGHGIIICQYKNIHLINTHLNPHSIKKRHHDLDFILSKINPLLQDKKDVIFGGDLNSFYIGEKEHYRDEKNHLRKWYSLRANANPHFENTVNGQFDFTLSQKLIAASLVDLLSQHNQVFRPSYLSNLGKKPLWQDPLFTNNNLSVSRLSARIDYLWASQPLSQLCTSCEIPFDPYLEEMSDHYPIVATFETKLAI